MKIDLSVSEAKLLDEHLSRQIERVEKELVHTDTHDMQRALAREVESLRTLRQRIASQVSAGA